jgi:hypothetical protein
VRVPSVASTVPRAWGIPAMRGCGRVAWEAGMGRTAADHSKHTALLDTICGVC